MKRRRISAKERLDILTRNNSRCHLCLGEIHPEREAWEVSHDIPLELGGDDFGENLKPAHKKCHRVQTSEIDIPAIAKMRRVRAKYLGAKPASRRKIQSRGFGPKKERRIPQLPLPKRRIMGE
jgi:5-methylcytosine-specific restriction protein A